MRALISDGQVSVQLEPDPHVADEAFACFDARLQHNGENPAACLRQVVSESQEHERVQLPGRSSFSKQIVTLEVQQCCLFWRDAEPESGEPLLHFLSKPSCVREVPKRGYEVSGRGELTLPALVEPGMNLAAHPAPIVQPSGSTPRFQ